MKDSAIFVLSTVLCLASTQNSPGLICNTCNCNIDGTPNMLYTLDCTSRGLSNTFPDLQNWPDEVRTEYSNGTGQQRRHVTTVVSFDGNAINEVSQFPELRGVMRLSLAQNIIEVIQPRAFSKLKNLQYLDLSYNRLTGTSIRADVLRGADGEPSEYEPLTLVYLNLAYNNIHSLSKRTFEHLPHLSQLRLSGNPLSVLDLPTCETLSYPNALKNLYLANIGLSSLPEQFVHLSSIRGNLEELVLSGNNFTEVPDSLGALGDSLRVLNLNGNPIDELNTNSFMGLNKLEQLSVSGMQVLKRVGPTTFAGLDSLRTLSCAHNPKLVDIDVDAFRELKEKWPLRELHLHDNALTWLPEGLAPWDKLETINIQGNPWQCDCKLEWFTKTLVPLIEQKDEEHALNLHCSAPLWLAGYSLLSLSFQPDGARSVLCNTVPPAGEESRPHERRMTPGVAALLSVTVLGCILAACGAAVACYRRLRQTGPVVLGNVVYKPVRPAKEEY